MASGGSAAGAHCVGGLDGAGLGVLVTVQLGVLLALLCAPSTNVALCTATNG